MTAKDYLQFPWEVPNFPMLECSKSKAGRICPSLRFPQRTCLRLGIGVLALGHPGGFDSRRGVIVRLGRIIGKKDETMQTDSRLLGGDSGGPLFDFEGKVIAIHSRVSTQPDQNFHIPIESFHANWDFFGINPSSRLIHWPREVSLEFPVKNRPEGYLLLECSKALLPKRPAYMLATFSLKWMGSFYPLAKT